MQEQKSFVQLGDLTVQFGSKGELSDNNLAAHLATCKVYIAIALITGFVIIAIKCI